jgi:hypothetical protein
MAAHEVSPQEVSGLQGDCEPRQSTLVSPLQARASDPLSGRTAVSARKGHHIMEDEHRDVIVTDDGGSSVASLLGIILAVVVVLAIVWFFFLSGNQSAPPDINIQVQPS